MRTTKKQTTMTRLNKTEIIKQVMNVYIQDTSKRSLYNNFCQYNSPEGNHCAVGQCLLPELHEKGVNLDGNTTSIKGLIERQCAVELDELLQEQYRGHEMTFWQNLQSLHDDDLNWDEHGLTSIGQREYNELLRIYAE